MMTKFYVYLLIDPRNGRPFYVGKGKGSRSQDHLRSSVRGKHYNPYLQNKIKKFLKRGLEYGVEFVFSSYDEQQCFEKEMFYISFFGRKSLCNLTDGGEGVSGFKISEESRAKLVIARTGEKNHFFGKHHSAEARAKNSAAHKGKPSLNKGTHHSEEALEKMRVAAKSRSAEWRHKISASKKGKPNPKISESKKGKPSWNKGRRMSEEARANMSASAKGKIISEEQRSKISESLKGEKNHFFGKHHNDGSRVKMAIARRGSTASDATKLKMSAAQSFRWAKHRESKVELISI